MRPLSTADVDFRVEPRRGTSAHDQKVTFLDTLAVLLGCTEGVGGEFPDGRRPDVLRIDADRGVLFIGDAKETESPGCQASLARLLSYLRWLPAQVVGRGGLGIFAICFGRYGDA